MIVKEVAKVHKKHKKKRQLFRWRMKKWSRTEIIGALGLITDIVFHILNLFK